MTGEDGIAQHNPTPTGLNRRHKLKNPLKESTLDEVKLYNPIAADQRLESKDIIRNSALLGILIMNIQSFLMVDAAYRNPLVFGNLNGINGAVCIFPKSLPNKNL